MKTASTTMKTLTTEFNPKTPYIYSMKKLILLTIAIILTTALNAQKRIQPIWQEDFESGAMPTGWSEKVGGAPFGWQFTENSGSLYWIIPAHTHYACINEDLFADADLSDVWLISSTIDLSEATSPLSLGMEHFPNPANQTAKFTIKISTDNGNNWVNLASVDPKTTWTFEEFDISKYAGEAEVKIAFHFNDGGKWEFGWAIDDVQIYHTLDHDMKVTKIYPEYYAAGKKLTPSVDIVNMASKPETNSFKVTLSNGKDYNEEVTINTTLQPSEKKTIYFPEWNTKAGNYKMNAKIEFSQDQDLTNNTLEKKLQIEELTYSQGAFALDATSQVYNKLSLENGTMSVITTTYKAPFQTSEEFNGDFIYRLHDERSICLVLPDGSVKNTTYITGIPSNGIPTSLAWDWDKKVMYLAYATLDAVTHFGTLDLSKFHFTEIGSGTSEVVLIAMDMANDGFLYGPATNTEKLYKINPETAEITEVGTLGEGIDIEFGQDVSFDRQTNKLYTITSGSVNGLGTYDLATGKYSEIFSYGGLMQVSTIVIISDESTTLAPTISKNDNTSVSPNPTTGIISINLTGKYNLQVIDLTGRVILDTKINNSTNIDLSNQKNGIYFVKLSNEKETVTHKIIKN